MKTQQRKFVVERKVGRRRLTMQPASIWGDTDLKALVREAEADAPHLFESNMVTDTADEDSERQTDPASEAHHNNDTDTGAQQPIVALPVEAEQNSPSQQGDDPTLNAAAQLKPDTPGRRSPKMAKRRRVAPGNQHVEGTNIAPSVRPTVAKAEVPADGLIALDEENRRLKGLLAQRRDTDRGRRDRAKNGRRAYSAHGHARWADKPSHRTALGARLSKAIEHAADRDRTVSLLFIDLDRFKFVNDSLGHQCLSDGRLAAMDRGLSVGNACLRAFKHGQGVFDRGAGGRIVEHTPAIRRQQF